VRLASRSAHIQQRRTSMFPRVDRTRARHHARALSVGAAAVVTFIGCAKGDAPRNDSGPALAPAPAESPSTAASATSGAATTPIRGAITAVTDSSLTVSTPTGAQQVHLVAPLHVYTRTASDLAHVTPNAFVGITSVAQPDGSQRATEIHVFPEELRGTGEGSRMMEQTSGGTHSTMTNGSVAPARMTNGTVRTGGGTSFTIRYQGGTQTIAIPPGVSVTAIVPTQTKLRAGANVVVLASTGSDGRLTASSVMLSGPTPAK
jgi:hypothetical protein